MACSDGLLPIHESGCVARAVRSSPIRTGLASELLVQDTTASGPALISA